MREIKFRVWDNLCSDMDTLDPNSVRAMYDWSLNALATDDPDWEVMQYTGLKDIDGREVYESDLFEHNGHIGVVRWHIDSWVVGFDDGKILHLFTDLKWGWILANKEVIGNIHENPELLDGN